MRSYFIHQCVDVVFLALVARTIDTVTVL